MKIYKIKRDMYLVTSNPEIAVKEVQRLFDDALVSLNLNDTEIAFAKYAIGALNQKLTIVTSNNCYARLDWQSQRVLENHKLILINTEA